MRPSVRFPILYSAIRLVLHSDDVPVSFCKNLAWLQNESGVGEADVNYEHDSDT